MVGTDSVGATGERPSAVDRQRIRANSLDSGTESDQEAREVLNVWLRRGIAQGRAARRCDRSTQSVLRCCDTRLVEKHIGTAQSRCGKPVRMVDGDFAPSCSKANRCVSMRRRPITSPPGGDNSTVPHRASNGPASSIEARIRAHNSGSRLAERTPWHERTSHSCRSRSPWLQSIGSGRRVSPCHGCGVRSTGARAGL